MIQGSRIYAAASRFGRALRQSSTRAHYSPLPSKMSAAGKAAFHSRFAQHLEQLVKENPGVSHEALKNMAFMKARFPRLMKSANARLAKPGELPKWVGGAVAQDYDHMEGLLKGLGPKAKASDAWKALGARAKLNLTMNPESLKTSGGKAIIAHELRHAADFRKMSHRKLFARTVGNALFVPYGVRKSERRAFNTMMRYEPNRLNRRIRRVDQHISGELVHPFGWARIGVAGVGGRVGYKAYKKRKQQQATA